MADLQKRDQYEAKLARKLGSIIAKANSEQAAKMAAGEHPAPATFAKGVAADVEKEAAALLLLIFAASAMQHGGSRETVGKQALTFARSAGPGISREIGAAARRSVDAVAAELKQRRSAGLDFTKGQIVQKLQTSFGPNLAASQAITATTIAVTAGSEFAVGSTVGLSPNDTWWTRPNLSKSGESCKLCSGLHGTKRAVWSVEVPAGPPAHPHCNCWIEYEYLTVTPGQTPSPEGLQVDLGNILERLAA